ncbi:MAG TPA: glycosyltransferase family 4 protein [Candidatus Sulfotelmatobacter sp.]|jgi:glycosyltransferase involved in cell wall biosynthesis|nr:glycosyltransferase family 4 protein [Candidatus Sulfotelmatobacter sp.]
MAAYDGEPPEGGQGAVMSGMRRSLQARGVEVRAVTGRGNDAIRYRHLLGRAPLDFSLHLNAHPQVLVSPGSDLVHLHGGPGGVLMLRRLPAPVVYTAHHTYRQAHSLGRPRRVLAPLEARAYRSAAMVLPVSASTASAVAEMGVHPSRIEVIAPGIHPLSGTAPSPRDPSRLLFVGRLEPEKGPLDAVAVMAALLASGVARSAAIIGDGHSREQVRRAAQAAGGSVEFLGRVDDVTLHREYSRAAVVLMPSRYEGLGLVALEAMAAGAAVVGYDVDGLRDSVMPAGGGVLTPVGQVDRLVEACRELLTNPARSGELGEHGRVHVLAHHTWERVAGRVEEIYRAVLSDG